MAKRVVIDSEECVGCQTCVELCPDVFAFNDAAEKITGYSRTEMLGRNWFEGAVPRDRYPHVCNRL